MNYLASLGLFRVLARQSPDVRIAWNNGVLQIVGGPKDLDGVLEIMCKIASQRAWTPYLRGWSEAQKQSTKRKSGVPLALWQAFAPEQDIELLNAHAVPAARVSYNPLLGSGGNAGKRDFSAGWRRAVECLRVEPPDAAEKLSELKRLLLGDSVTWMLEKLNGASWFSDTNKLYNSGQKSLREGVASPWSIALACEGLPFFAGGASRRLGARARAVGAFPFVTREAAPNAAGEAGRELAEIWAPIWHRPMSPAEVLTVFRRGRAELGGHGVLTPSAFATAVMRRGVDAGLSEFRRFVLERTTSSNTFEPRFGGVFQVRVSGTSQPTAFVTSETDAMERLVSLVDQFRGPMADRKAGKRWRYVGLRGGIEAAMLRLAESPSDPEAARDLSDSVVKALDRIDRNQTFRKKSISWEPLPLCWLPALFGDERPTAEARLALSLVSSFPADRPFATYRFGVQQHGRRFVHSPQIPKRWVWRSVAPAASALTQILYRRSLDWEAKPEAGEPVRAGVPATSADVANWLSSSLDDDLVARWVSRFALFDWKQKLPTSVRSLTPKDSVTGAARAALCLFGLLQPLFDLRPVPLFHERASDLLPPNSGARTPSAARRLLGLLRAPDIAAAVRFAATRYAIAAAPVVRSGIPWDVNDPERLTASLLFQISSHDRSILIARWLRPTRKQEEQFS